MMKKQTPRPIALIVLDGWGYREEKEANAIAAAHKPNWDKLWLNYPHTLLNVSGPSVGLPPGQMGNSEVGHLTIGAGRIVYQDLTRIDVAIENKDFFHNTVLTQSLEQAKKNNKAVHIMGLLSSGGVHSHERHFHAVIELASQMGLDKVYLHPFLDGRDTPPQSALNFLQSLENHCKQYHCGKIVSLIGRYYAMDRDKRWERIQKAYLLLVNGDAMINTDSVEEAIKLAYARGETDEFIQATSIHPPNKKPITIQDGDIVIFMNFRADRARELTQALTDEQFSGFARENPPKLGAFISLCEYDPRYHLPSIFPPETHHDLLAELISKRGLKQLRIAETEKYAHVTFFFNGGIEPPFPGEDRLLIPSPKVSTYDQKPEMSAIELTDHLVTAIESETYDLIICNYANPDMVGHSGNFSATVKAIETIDKCLGRIINSLEKIGGEALITADHGNAEQMWDEKTGQPHTAHTLSPVPLIYFGSRTNFLNTNGKLSDIAPTILNLLNISKPKAMTGSSLLNLV